jgi:hypothetical protein
MATLKQQKVVENSRNNFKTKGELLRASGYSENTAIKPSQVLESKGIQKLKETAESMGIDETLTLTRVKEAMEHRNLNLAVQTIFNWWRIIYPNEKPETQVNLQVNNIQITTKDKEEWAIKYLESNGYKIEKIET